MVKMFMKYKALVTWPIASYGGSTGLAPIHVRMIRILIKDQNFVFLLGENFVLFGFIFIVISKIAMDITNATTPPSFEGIDRRIAYANRKYHSGWM